MTTDDDPKYEDLPMTNTSKENGDDYANSVTEGYYKNLIDCFLGKYGRSFKPDRHVKPDIGYTSSGSEGNYKNLIDNFFEKYEGSFKPDSYEKPKKDSNEGSHNPGTGQQGNHFELGSHDFSAKMSKFSKIINLSWVLLLSTHSVTCHTTPFQMRQVLCKSGSNYSTLNGLKPTRAIFMPRRDIYVRR